ncbi:hypothetical protein SISNIDRAFT_469128 [Sistotremastrum niveocremeum HHB9708]|uniref:Uncharacterized protein n=1 Tax=Sistotremastrum niveocremeum HHB9708 TaxID=1314777 RepID=A0A164QFH8_9AGAM|nr:hypothetical protein SISNIDRAFT_469128 [Sistotremastrum niveocremeum HHB9708]
MSSLQAANSATSIFQPLLEGQAFDPASEISSPGISPRVHVIATFLRNGEVSNWRYEYARVFGRLVVRGHESVIFIDGPTMASPCLPDGLVLRAPSTLTLGSRPSPVNPPIDASALSNSGVRVASAYRSSGPSTSNCAHESLSEESANASRCTRSGAALEYLPSSATSFELTSREAIRPAISPTWTSQDLDGHAKELMEGGHLAEQALRIASKFPIKTSFTEDPKKHTRAYSKARPQCIVISSLEMTPSPRLRLISMFIWAIIDPELQQWSTKLPSIQSHMNTSREVATGSILICRRRIYTASASSPRTRMSSPPIALKR